MQVGVIGSGSCYDDVCEFAFRLGQLLAERGCVVINGGLGGVMEAVSRGVSSRGGVAIGIVPGKDRRDANPYCKYVIATNMGHARNMIIVHSSDVLVAVGGGYGTVSEMAIALKEGKRVVAYKPAVKLEGLIVVKTPEEAVSKALEGLE
ncbi:TIGR00725 family protein [Geoglobus ahangari]|uniref:TIGR00725 family protein n=1 Tax=Geoglobus ahangari TaxID=113653 RepID=A0A0F7IE33_9EURY|nr:TIGR00725 family protein [Geoglobus ahangari]AKG91752.1 TIGR00725 family protein [Geoglobus ahangari]